MPTEKEVREEALAEAVNAYVKNADKEFGSSERLSREDLAQYTNSLIAERKVALLKNMFGHLSVGDLTVVAKLALSCRDSILVKEPADIGEVEDTVEVKRGRGRPKKLA
jgi:hypothetical protein